MPIPERDLATMANIGAQVTSKDTYRTVRLALEAPNTGYSGKAYEIFLQGSYGNDTNVFRESDVDVVIRLDAIFSYDLAALAAEQQAAFAATHGAATYTHAQFRNDVLAALRSRFGDDVLPGNKAVAIAASHNRRKADVIIAIQHRRYLWYVSDRPDQNSYVPGISFRKADGTRVINYPGQHRANLTEKNQRTNEWFKHIVRIFKNARQKMVENGYILAGNAPSYYLEGLLYNVPNDCFGTSYADSMVACINWLYETDRSQYLCANEQYPLLDGNPDVTWRSTECTTFLQGIVALWDGW